MKRLILVLVLLAWGCGIDQPTSRFTKLDPDSIVNIWAEMEVTSQAPASPLVIDQAARQLSALASDIRSGKVKPGPEVQFVQVLIKVRRPEGAAEKLGLLRFPLNSFAGFNGADPRGILDQAETVEPSSAPSEAERAFWAFCADNENRKASPVFCLQVDAKPV